MGYNEFLRTMQEESEKRKKTSRDAIAGFEKINRMFPNKDKVPFEAPSHTWWRLQNQLPQQKQLAHYTKNAIL